MRQDRLVLGIARGHDVSAALFRGSKLLGVAESERVVNIKHARGPSQLSPAVNVLCAENGVLLEEIDSIAIADTGREALEARYPEKSKDLHGSLPIAQLGSASLLETLPLGGVEGTINPDASLFFVCHHAAHALSALYLSGYSECTILVVDGYGTCCGTIPYHYKDGKLSRLEDLKDSALLGWRYQLFGHFPKEINSEKTDILDLAGKVMGLNAYGDINSDYVKYFESWFKKDIGDYKNCWALDKSFFDDLIAGGLRKDHSSVNDKGFLDLVASMQEAYTNVLCELASLALLKTGSKNLIVTGGCALNVLANSRINEIAENVFFPPNAGDSGLALGAASSVAAHLRKDAFHHPEISPTVRANPYVGLKIKGLEKLEGMTTDFKKERSGEHQKITSRNLATLLIEGKIVGLLRSQCEIGPRALGNRSILAYPGYGDMRNIINEKIKYREWWRPFAPVCRMEDYGEYFETSAPSPYMLTTARVRERYQEGLRPACHEDGTARLQVIPSREWNPLLWDILGVVKEKTGIGVLINTSYNESGKPLCNSIESAFELFEKTQMDAIWIEGWLFSKNESGGPIL